MGHLLKPLSAVALAYLVSTLTLGYWLQYRDLPVLAILATVMVVVSTSSHALFLAWVGEQSSATAMSEETGLDKGYEHLANRPGSSFEASDDSRSLRSIISELVTLEDQYATDRQILQSKLSGGESSDSGLAAAKSKKQEL